MTKKRSERYQELMKRENKGNEFVFTDEEIEFLAKEDLVDFYKKFPAEAQHYMAVLS